MGGKDRRRGYDPSDDRMYRRYSHNARDSGDYDPEWDNEFNMRKSERDCQIDSRYRHSNARSVRDQVDGRAYPGGPVRYRASAEAIDMSLERDEIALQRRSMKDGGEPRSYDPHFKGPLKSRSCTDIFFLLVFVVFLVGWAIVAAVAIEKGHPEKLVRPTDSLERLCGVGELQDRPYLFFFDFSKCVPIFKEGEIVPTFGCWTHQVCVANCPNETFSAIRYINQNLDPEKEKMIKSKMICTDNADVQNKSLKDLLTSGVCAPYYLESISLAGRCIPDLNKDEDLVDKIAGNDTSGIVVDKDGKTLSIDDLKKQLKKVKKFMEARAWAQQFVEDIGKSWKFILGGLFLAMIVAFIYIVLMRFFAGLMVWFSIIAMIVLFSWFTIASFMRWKELEGVEGADGRIKLSRRLDAYTSKRQTWIILGSLSGIILAILLLTLLFLRSRIRLAIVLIREGAKVIGHMPSALFFPILPYILQIITIGFFISVLVLLASCQTAKQHEINTTVSDPEAAEPRALFGLDDEPVKNAVGNMSNTVTVLVAEQFTSYAHIYNFFGFLWMMAFISAIGQLALAGGVASYYWAFKKPNDVPYFAVLTGLWMTFRYHLGSAAFGSLIIAIIRFIRAILVYIQKKLKKYDNDFTKCCLKCCMCCFWLLEKFMLFINKNAYIMISIYGKNFCWSAREAFLLLLRNAARVVVLDKVTDFLLFIAKLVVVGGCGLFSFYFFTRKITALNHHVPDLNYQYTPVVMITIGAYVISSCFFHVYDMTVDTLFLCFLEDCERNDGSKEKPYYMSKELMKIFDKKKYRELKQASPPTQQ